MSLKCVSDAGSQGIVPNLAAQAHKERLDVAIADVFRQSGLSGFESIDGLAFTRGPGLSACLDIGLKKTRYLASKYDLQTVAINHMEGHLLASRLEDRSVKFPFLCLLVSGGHSQIVAASGVGDYKMLGETLDIALGDAFDKVARALHLCDLNGGKMLEQSAKLGNPFAFKLPMPLKAYKNCDLSFSGLQTAVDVEIEKINCLKEHTLLNSREKLSPASGVRKQHFTLSPQEVSDLAASFQYTCIEHLVRRLKHAIKWCKDNAFETQTLVISGGVACNNAIFDTISKRLHSDRFTVIRPSASLCSDNAVMIGWAAQENVDAGKHVLTPEELANTRYIPRWPLDESGKDYFPDSHPSHASTPIAIYREEVLTKHLEALGENFTAQTAIRAIRAYLSLKKIEEAHLLVQRAMEAFPGDTHLERMAKKVVPMYTSWHNKYQ